MIRLVLAVSAVTMVTGCSAARVGPTMSAAPGSGARGSRTPAEKICRDTFPNRTVLGWMSANVGELRAHQLGGPAAHYPLRSAFAGVAATNPGAWCVLREGAQSASLWGAVPGIRPERDYHHGAGRVPLPRRAAPPAAAAITHSQRYEAIGHPVPLPCRRIPPSPSRVRREGRKPADVAAGLSQTSGHQLMFPPR
jgi:hypothetical protein